MAAPALALDPNANSSAYGISISGLVTVNPTPTNTCPPGGHTDTVNVNLGALGNAQAVSSTANCDTTAGTSNATASVAKAALLIAGVVPVISADVISATCSDNAPAAPTGSTTLTAAKLGANTALALHPGPNTGLTIPRLLSVVLNEQSTDSNGTLTVNAVHITLLGGNAANIIIGHVTCGPNAAATPAFSFGETPVIIGGIAVLLALVFGIRAGVRRMHGAQA